jgi:hypothetical protein
MAIARGWNGSKPVRISHTENDVQGAPSFSPYQTFAPLPEVFLAFPFLERPRSQGRSGIPQPLCC